MNNQSEIGTIDRSIGDPHIRDIGNPNIRFIGNPHIRTKAEFIGMLNPKAWDAISPHSRFVFSDAFVELLVADVVRQIATAISDRAQGKKALQLSQRMAAAATTSLAAAWEPGDEICPPWPWPWPGPRPWGLAADGSDPSPQPWKPIASAEQIELAHVLTRLSGLTASKEFNGELKVLAVAVVNGVAGKLADDFEQCGTVPRKPFPKGKTAHSN